MYGYLQLSNHFDLKVITRWSEKNSWCKPWQCSHNQVCQHEEPSAHVSECLQFDSTKSQQVSPSIT